MALSADAQSRLAQLVPRIKAVKDSKDAYVLMLGAGASISSGMPLTSTMLQKVVEDWHAAPGPTVEQRFDQLWRDSQPSERAQYLDPYLAAAKPSCGYQRLANLIRDGYFPIIITFNFDDLLERSLRAIGLAEEVDFKCIRRGETIDEQIAVLLSAPEPRIKIVKLHGSVKSTNSLLFDSTQMLQYEPPVAKIVEAITARNIVTCGYGFEDLCVLKAFSRDGGAIVSVGPSGVPSKLRGYLPDRKSENRDVQATFDDFFQALNAALTGDSTPCDAGPPPSPARRANPFKFLQSFDENDADRFSGRDDEIGVFMDRVANHPRVIVIYGSGRAGKTSLVRAGLLPQLKEPAFWAIYLRLQKDDLTAAVLDALGRTMHLPDGVKDISTALQHVSKIAGEKHVVLFLDRFERTVSDVRDNMRAIQERFAPLLPADSPKNLTIVPIVTDEAALASKLMQACGRALCFLVECPAFERARVVEIISRTAASETLSWPTAITERIADEFERTRRLGPPERFTLAHVQAVCHLLAWEPEPTLEAYERLFAKPNRDALNDAIHVIEFANCAEDWSYPNSAWLRTMLRVPLQESKEKIASYIAKHTDQLMPPPPPSQTGGQSS